MLRTRCKRLLEFSFTVTSHSQLLSLSHRAGLDWYAFSFTYILKIIMLNFASTIPQTKNTTTYGYIRLKMQQLRYSTIRDNCQRAADEISFPFVALDTGSRHCTHTLKRQNSTRSFSFQSINLKKKNAQPPPPLFDTEKLYTFCTKWREGIESAVHYVSEKRMHNHRHLTLTLKK